MLERQMDKLTEEMMKVDRMLRRRKKPVDPETLGRRIGRWQGKYPAANKLLEIEVNKDKQGNPTFLKLYCCWQGNNFDQLRKGTYLLRTNCTETDPSKLWRWYMQLTQAEAAFRTAKSDIGLRPIYHQKTERVEAHLLICFLNLAMWRSLEMWMNAKGLGTCARKLVQTISEIKSMDVVVPVQRESRSVELRLRTVARPDEDVAILLSHLGLHLPRKSKIVQNVVEKNEQN